MNVLIFHTLHDRWSCECLRRYDDVKMTAKDLAFMHVCGCGVYICECA